MLRLSNRTHHPIVDNYEELETLQKIPMNSSDSNSFAFLIEKGFYVTNKQKLYLFLLSL